MPRSCKSGTIRRKAYTRKAYTRKTGTRVAATKVPSACISDVGNPGKGFSGPGTGIGKLKEGKLSDFGYSVKKTARSRHTALNAAAKARGPLVVYHELNALSVYTKNTSPSVSKLTLADRNYVGEQHGYKSA